MNRVIDRRGLEADDAGRESQLAGQHALGRNFGETTTTKTGRASSLRQASQIGPDCSKLLGMKTILKLPAVFQIDL
jgi:hypothetical protein